MSLPASYSWILNTSTSGGAASTQGSGAGNRTSGNGKTGIALPFSADGRGRLALVSGDKQLQKIIMTNLSNLDSDNPYQGDIGIGADMVFAVASTRLRTDVRRKVNALFRRLQLQDRARLNGDPEFIDNSELQEVTCSISYVNLEENKPGQVGLKFSLANAVS